MSEPDNPEYPIARTFQVRADNHGRTLAIHITEPRHIKADNLSLETWASSNILADVVHDLGLASTLSDAQPSIPILELGAGTALVGLTAAALTGAETILTDLPGIVPGIAANIGANRQCIAPSGAVVRAGSLDWREPEWLELGDGSRIAATERKARVVFAADVIYDEMHPALLEKAVFAWLERGPEARFVICWPLRVAYLDHIRDMWERLEAGGLVAEREGRATGVPTNGDDELLCEWVVWKWGDGMEKI